MVELIPGHYNEEITDADGPMEIWEPFFINEATFIDIIVAASAQTFPKTLKITAGKSGGE